MSKELEAFHKIMETYGNTNSLEGTYNDFLTIKQALQHLEAIDNSNPSEALSDLESFINNIIFAKDIINQKQQLLTNINTIKQALIKSQEQEKDKVFLKNLHNTKVKVPLVAIFSGLPQEKRFAYTEHIYYHWEEMKEALEAEIENIKTEKENLELKTREQGHVLEIIFEKNVDILELRIFIEHYSDKVALKRYNSKVGNELQLTEDEFKLLKRYFKNGNNL